MKIECESNTSTYPALLAALHVLLDVLPANHEATQTTVEIQHRPSTRDVNFVDLRQAAVQHTLQICQNLLRRCPTLKCVLVDDDVCHVQRAPQEACGAVSKTA